MIARALDACAHKLDGSAASPEYYRRRRRVFYSALKYAVREKRLSADPLDGLRLDREWKAPNVDHAIDRRRVDSPAQMRQLLDAIRLTGKSQGPRLVALYGCMYYGMLQPSKAVSLLLDECESPAAGWGCLEFREVRSAAGREWTDDGEVHEVHKPKGGPKNSVRRVPIPPELVRLLREHVESYGPLLMAASGLTAAAFTSRLPHGRCCGRPGRRRFLLLSSPRRWPASRMTSGMPGSRGGLMLELLARRSPSGQVTAWKCSTGSMRTASMGTVSAGTGRWRTSLASLEATCTETSLSRFLSWADAPRFIPRIFRDWQHRAPSGGIRLHSRSGSSGAFSQVSMGLAWW